MNTKLISLMLALMCIYVFAPAKQSERDFVDEAGGYKLTLAGDWQPVTYTDAVGRTKTEFVCRERGEGLLRVGKERPNRRPTADIIRHELKDLELCKPGVEVGGEEIFAGGMLPGWRVAFCYIEDGRWVAATYYFLEDHNSVWILRFTGRVGSLDANRDVTDQIARNFSPVWRMHLLTSITGRR